MFTLLGALLGAVTNFFPSIMDYFNKKQDHRQKIELFQLEINKMEKMNELGIKMVEAKADASEGDSLRAHDSELDGGVFINALRASVRPVITYVFFLLFTAIKVYAVINYMGDNNVPLSATLPVIWDAETQAIFASIIGFWFGSRTIASFMKRG